MALRLLTRVRQAFRPTFQPRRNFRNPPEGKTLDSQKGVLEFIDSHGGGAGASRNGRAWRTSELRLKCYDDLHKLWFILMKERNVLLTEKAWCKTNGRHWVNGQSNLYKVKRSMQKIKGVVGERIRAARVKESALALKEEVEKVGIEAKDDREVIESAQEKTGEMKTETKVEEEVEKGAKEEAVEVPKKSE